MILGVFNQLQGPGGIQRVGRHAAAVLSEFAHRHAYGFRILSLNDPPGEQQTKAGTLGFNFQGFGGHRVALALAVLRAVPAARLAYFGHPYLSPLGLLLKLKPSIRYLVATHGIDIWQPLSWIRRLGLQRASLATAASRFTAETIEKAQDLNPGKIALIPWATDPGFGEKVVFANSPGPVLPRGRLILTVARLAPSERYKGVADIIRALPRVLDSVPDAYHVIVGEGEDSPRLQSLARETGVASRVIFLGRCTEKELAHCYDECDVYVMPSKMEDFGLVFLEAMAVAKPVIGGNHGGTPDVIVDGTTGYLVDHGDVATLSLLIIRLLTDKGLRQKMGQEGWRRWQQRYTFERFEAALSKVLASQVGPVEEA